MLTDMGRCLVVHASRYALAYCQTALRDAGGLDLKGQIIIETRINISNKISAVGFETFCKVEV